MNESRYVEFVADGVSESGRTKKWEVRTKSNNVLLGRIRWYAPWRGYCCFISSRDGECDLVFGKSCLRDIADFCEEQTVIQRTKRKEVEAK